MAVNPQEFSSSRDAAARTSVAEGSSAGGQTEARPKVVARRDARGRKQQFQARKVRRLVRHVDVWSVLKLSLLFFICMWLIAMIASVIIWTVAHGSGTVEKLETFIETNLERDDFRFNGEFMFRQLGLIGLILAMAATATAAVSAVIFNLISDVIGGIWVSVIEEETARPIQQPAGQQQAAQRQQQQAQPPTESAAQAAAAQPTQRQAQARPPDGVQARSADGAQGAKRKAPARKQPAKQAEKPAAKQDRKQDPKQARQAEARPQEGTRTDGQKKRQPARSEAQPAREKKPASASDGEAKPARKPAQKPAQKTKSSQGEPDSSKGSTGSQPAPDRR